MNNHTLKFQAHEIQVSGDCVMIKAPTGDDSYNWITIAWFSFAKDQFDAHEAAKQYAKSITA